ncbi:COQ9 family protein [Aliigemmobacter aestuarii]|uniref:COQ9 family protein n=1 Tax=Aliigemmobacter aestuarii TaxID=1445661 RepID=A0A4S3MN00_9RHOB|nr:COQ9 family protein [Gemmobacter aestuarii]THD83830.1 COQ9 family protein [Gemmobacter aestuarii]
MQTENGTDTARDAVLDAALMHVPFDGWSETAFRAAVADSGVAEGLARALFPRGAVDMALEYHRRGDRLMADRLAGADLSQMRYSERVAHAIRTRLEMAEDKELVRRGTTLFALPVHAADGAKAIWGTADAIWRALGDTSVDINWYTKRATLSAVYGSTVLYWLGDDSPGHERTWEFLSRRIADVMSFEKWKASARENPLAKAVLKPLSRVMDRVTAPAPRDDLPGRTRT